MTQLTGKIILGTVQFGMPYGINNTNGIPTQETIFQLLDAAYDEGIRGLDTADAYGDAIAVIAAYHGQTEKRFSVNNKFSAATGDASWVYDHVARQLALLQVPFFEHYLFHKADDISDPSYMKIMTGLKEKGLVKQVGGSVYTNEQCAAAIAADGIDSIQLPYNLLDNHNKRGELLERAKAKGKQVHTRSVFLQGLFFMESERLPAKLLSLSPYLESIKAIASKNNLAVNELALQYVLRNKNIDKVLIGVDSLSHLHAAVDAIHSEIDENVLALVDEIDLPEATLLNPVNWQ